MFVSKRANEETAISWAYSDLTIVLKAGSG